MRIIGNGSTIPRIPVPIPDQILILIEIIASQIIDIPDENRAIIRRIHEELDEIEHELARKDS